MLKDTEFFSVNGLPAGDRIRIGVTDLKQGLVFDICIGGTTNLGEVRRPGERAAVVWYSNNPERILRRFEVMVSRKTTLFGCSGTPEEFRLAYHNLWQCCRLFEEHRFWKYGRRRKPYSQPRPLWPLLRDCTVTHPENPAEEPLTFELSIPGALLRYRDRIPFEMPEGTTPGIIALAGAMLEAHGALRSQKGECQHGTPHHQNAL